MEHQKQIFALVTASILMLSVIGLPQANAEQTSTESSPIEISAELQTVDDSETRHITLEIHGKAICRDNVLSFKNLRGTVTLDGEQQRTRKVIIQDVSDNTTIFQIKTRSIDNLTIATNFFGLLDCTYITLNGGLFMPISAGTLVVNDEVFTIDPQFGFVGFRYLN